ncbi:MAG: SIR2 family protein [Alphaproteobacteria bacterium]|nr:SIR2 family protein [Alphaproteobacteria bacterium]MCB9791862.1 SIR2 family protein [Alphaproteobacteria bacterium]
MNLPVEVVEAAQRRRCALIVGSRASAEAAEEQGLDYPGERELSRALGGRKSLREACARFEEEHGRAALIGRLREARGAEALQPGPFHHAAVRRFDRIFTSTWDTLLEQAAEAAGRRFEVRQRLAPIPEPDEDVLLIYRLRGQFSSPGGMVVTQNDHFSQPFGDMKVDVRKLLRRDVAFFVGYRPDEEEFDHTFDDLSDAFGGELPRCHLAVAQGRISDYHWQKWVWRGLLLFTADPGEALAALEEQIDG